MFTAPWCGHCKKFRPYFLQACKEVQSVRLKCAIMNQKQNQDFMIQYRIGAFPSVILFKKNTKTNEINHTVFDINTNEEIMTEWIFNEVRQAPILLTIDSIQPQQDKIQILYFTNSEDLSFLEKISNSKELDYSLNFYQIKSETEKLIIRKIDEEIQFPAQPSNIPKESIIHWIQHFSYPKVINFNEKIAKTVFKQFQPMIIFFLDEENNQQYNSILEQLSNDLREEVFIVVSTQRNEQEQRLIKFLKLEINKYPLIKLIFPERNEEPKQYEFTKEFTYENFLDFYHDWKMMKLHPEYRSEQPPTEQKINGVIKVVGKTFGSIVMDEQKDVFVKFYAPWCGHCKSLEPIFEELAQKLEGIESLVIAKYDATQNNNEGINIRSFPTLKFYPAGNKATPISYNGERDINSFIKFLKEHSTIEWKDKKDQIEKIEL